MLLAVVAGAWAGGFFGAGLGVSTVAGDIVPVGAGLSEHCTLGFSLGEASLFEVAFDHAKNPIADARGFFPGVRIDPETITGERRYVAPEVAFQLGFPLPIKHPDRQVVAWPTVRFGAGLSYTVTSLTVPGFLGRTPFVSNAVAPMAVLGAGAEVRIGERWSLNPGIRLQGTVFENGSEGDGASEWGMEWRVQPTLVGGVSFGSRQRRVGDAEEDIEGWEDLKLGVGPPDLGGLEDIDE